jgi:anti-sigma regulatory factor (Ser/Thr protein kinase)
MSPAAPRLEVELAPDVKAPERARRSLENVQTELTEEVLDDVRLLVNELVTNSVKFGGDGLIQLRVSGSGQSVRVEVHDEGPGFAPPGREPSMEDISGRGLFLVDAIADRWGVSLDGTTCVWFEIDKPEREAC